MRISAPVILALTLASTLALGTPGCSEREAPVVKVDDGPHISVLVAALDLPLMTDACYGLSVFNTAVIEDMNATSLVWTQPNLCASDYGAAGGIRFTGICDAQAGGFDANGEALDPDHNNTVMLVLNDLYTGGDWDGDGVALMPTRDYVNPCPEVMPGTDNDCILKVPCTANQDAKVLFNLTVMRDAQIGFFDTVVKFQDVFCAAKLDCVDDDNQTMLYLYNPDANPPGDGPTAVLGFTCLGGDGDAISMYLDDLEITCTTGSGDTYAVTRTATVDPSGGPGHLATPYLVQSGASEVLFGANVNSGAGAQGAQYWNVLLGLNLPGEAGETCTLHTTGTVSEAAFSNNTTPTPNRYPYIDWTVTLTEDGERVCGRHPLNGDDGGVATVYTPIDAPTRFDHTLTFGTTCPCWTPADLSAQTTTIANDGIYLIARVVSELATIFQLQDENLSLFVGAGTNEDTLGCCIGPGGFNDLSELACIWGITQAEVDVCISGVHAVVDNTCATAGECALGCQSAAPGEAQCLECIYDSDCQGGQHCESGIFECVSDGCLEDCVGAGMVCDLTTQLCVECLGDQDCTDPSTPTCDPSNHQCIPG